VQPEPSAGENVVPKAREDNDTLSTTTASGGRGTDEDNKLTYHQDLEGEMGRRGRRERQRGGVDAGGSREASRSPESRSKTAVSSTGECESYGCGGDE
jgi:hypothetical protein